MNLCTKYNDYHVSNIGFDEGAPGALPPPPPPPGYSTLSNSPVQMGLT